MTDPKLDKFADLANEFATIGVPIANIDAGNNDRKQRDRAMKLYQEWKKKADQFFMSVNSEEV